MKTSAVLAGSFASAALGAIQPKNFIFVIPDGLSPASQTIVRTYKALTEGGATPEAPGFFKEQPLDQTVSCLRYNARS